MNSSHCFVIGIILKFVLEWFGSLVLNASNLKIGFGVCVYIFP